MFIEDARVGMKVRPTGVRHVASGADGTPAVKSSVVLTKMQTTGTPYLIIRKIDEAGGRLLCGFPNRPKGDFADWFMEYDVEPLGQ